MAAKVKYRVNLLSAFDAAFGDKPIEVRSRLRRYLSDYDVKNVIGNAIIEKIVDRTAIKRVDKNNSSLDNTGPYSKGYQSSLAFKVYGKSKSRVDLTLSGDMLGSIVAVSKGTFTIDITMADKLNNDKAHGNIYGTYGRKSGDPRKARDFLGLPDKELVKIVREVLIDASRDGELLLIDSFVDEFSRDFEIGGFDE